eukprot:Gb_01985 [translate_table: standard]
MTIATPLLSDSDPTSCCNDEMERRRRGNNEEDWGLSIAIFPFQLDVPLRTIEGSTLVWIGRLPGGHSLTRQGNLAHSVVNSLPLPVALALCFVVWWKMGGDPITTEPLVLKVDEEVREILEKAGLIAFFRKFLGFSESISIQVAESWDEGKVERPFSEEKTSQAKQLTKFLTYKETFCWLQSNIARESLPKSWDRVAVQIMKYLTLEGKLRKIFGYHVAILNSIKNEEKVNIPLFLFKSLEKSIKSVKVGKGKVMLHQGLVKFFYQFAKDKGGVSIRMMRGGFPRISGTLVSRAQLRLGATPLGKDSLSLASKPNVVLTESKDEEDSPKKESEGKHKLVDYVDSSKEDKGGSDNGKDAETGKVLEEPVPVSLPNKGATPKPHGTFTILEELRCHLKILNGVGCPVTSTCACINLPALEITNYLKEVVSKLKDMGSVESQVQFPRSRKKKKLD